jgi:hypothetical protein
MTPAEAVEQSRREQGLPPKIEDEETLAAIAAIILDQVATVIAPVCRLNGPLPKRARTSGNRSEPYHNQKQRFRL